MAGDFRGRLTFYNSRVLGESSIFKNDIGTLEDLSPRFTKARTYRLASF